MSPNKAKQNSRAGTFIQQPGGCRAFIPKPLPPSPPIQYTPTLVNALSHATLTIGRLDGAADVLPNPDLFVAMYVRKEAVLSSQIENTQASLADVLEYEAGAPLQGLPLDVGEVVNYVGAMNYGLERLKSLPLSLRLIREIHAKLLAGVRGGDRTPGEFRIRPNWIGPPGCTLAEAVFVPPPVPEMHTALGDLEAFMRRRDHAPLIQIGLAHAQFETIHPFLDGNGRVGRLMITFMLCERKILCRPLLYLSRYLVANKQEYYDRLMAVRLRGEWEEWLNFFLKGVATVSEEASQKARRIIDLRDKHRAKIDASKHRVALSYRLLELLYQSPVVTMPETAKRLQRSRVTANDLIWHFEQLGFLQEITGKTRNRRFRYQPYYDLLNE